MKIVRPVEKPVRQFCFPITIYTLSKTRNRLFLAVFFLMAMGFLYATSILAKADRYQQGLDHYLVQHRYLYYLFIAVLIIAVLLPILFPTILSNGNIRINADTIVITQGGLKPFQMTVPKKQIRSFSLEIPNNNTRVYIRTGSTLHLEDGRHIEFDIISSSIKNRQGIRLLYILEAAVKSEGLDTFSVTR